MGECDKLLITSACGRRIAIEIGVSAWKFWDEAQLVILKV
jgi:hypothetical protein